MADALTSFLNSQLTDDFVLINDILKSDDQYKSKSLDQLRQYISKLVIDGKIEVKDKAYDRLGLHTRLNPGDYQNTMTDLDNWLMYAKITELGKGKIMATNKAWYDTENARRQFEDYPKTKQRAKAAIIISIISVVITLILGLLKLKC